MYSEACMHAFVIFVFVTELRLCVILLGLLIVSWTQVKWPMEVERKGYAKRMCRRGKADANECIQKSSHQ